MASRWAVIAVVVMGAVVAWRRGDDAAAQRQQDEGCGEQAELHDAILRYGEDPKAPSHPEKKHPDQGSSMAAWRPFLGWCPAYRTRRERG
jgi:hypothetical protein